MKLWLVVIRIYSIYWQLSSSMVCCCCSHRQRWALMPNCRLLKLIGHYRNLNRLNALHVSIILLLTSCYGSCLIIHSQKWHDCTKINKIGKQNSGKSKNIMKCWQFTNVSVPMTLTTNNFTYSLHYILLHTTLLHSQTRGMAQPYWTGRETMG